MPKHNKKIIFEEKFADNFQPNFFEKVIQKFELHRSKVLSQLLPPKSGTLVDLACGDGVFLKSNAGKFSKGIGYDISQTRIKNAKRLLKPFGKKMRVSVRDLDEGIPLTNNSVDVVVCEASLAYFVRPDLVIAEVHRILKKSGVFILQIGNYAFFSRRLALLFGSLPKISSFTGFGDGGMLHYFTYDSLEALLLEHGLKVVEQSNSGLVANFRKIWPTALASDIIYKAVKK